MLYQNVQNLYQPLALFLILSLILGCETDPSEKNIDLPIKKIISFHSYQDSTDSRNSILLQIPDSAMNGINRINIRIYHSAGCAPMTNFNLSIYTDDNGYWPTDDFRFLERKLNSVNDTIIEKVLDLESCKFHSFKDSLEISYAVFRNRIYSSRRIAISASMNDFDLLKNPLSSSSLRHSNLIELIYE